MNKQRTTRSIMAVTAIAALAVIGMTTQPASATPADPSGAVTGTHDATVNSPFGLSDAFGPNTDDAVYEYVYVEGTAVQVSAYCVETGVPFMVDGSNWTAVGHDKLRVGSSSALAQATWIIRNGTRYSDDGTSILGTVDSPSGDTEANAAPGALGDGAWGTKRFNTVTDGIPANLFNRAETAAMQLAVWSLVNGRDISGTANPGILARANELIALAQAGHSIAEVPYSYTLDVAFTPDASTTFGTVDVSLNGVKSTGTHGVGGISVTVSVPDGSGIDLDKSVAGVQTSRDVVTDSSGHATFDADTTNSANVIISATTNDLQLLPGALLQPADNGDAHQQQLLVAEAGAIVRSAAVTAPAVAAATTTTAGTETTTPATTVPVTTVAPVTTTTPTNLPHTGGLVTWQILLAFGALGGLGLYLLRRRPARQ